MAEESNANVALVEGAEPTPGASLTPPEGSPAPKDGEKPGEALSNQEKPSQETPSPDDSKDDEEPKDGVVNIHAHRRIKTERNELRTRLRDLAELGINSKEDAETLLKEAETVETEAKQKGIQEITDWLVSSPREFLTDLHKKHPEAYEQIVQSDVYSFANAIAGSNKELAEQILAAAQEFFGNEPRSGRRAPESSGRDSVSQERTAMRQEKQELFEEQAAADFHASFDPKLKELTKGLNFHSDKQKERFFRNVKQGVKEALDRNPIFTRQWDRMADVGNLSPSQLRERRREAVDLHIKHATDDLLRRCIEEEKSVLGISIAQKLLDKDGERREVTGSGAPPNGKGLTQDAKDRKYEELQQKYSGRMLEARYAEWLMGDRA